MLLFIIANEICICMVTTVSILVSKDVKNFMAGKYSFCHYVSILFFRNQHQVFQEPEQSFYLHMLTLSNATAKP